MSKIKIVKESSTMLLVVCLKEKASKSDVDINNTLVKVALFFCHPKNVRKLID